MGKHGEKIEGVTPKDWAVDYVDYQRGEVRPSRCVFDLCSKHDVDQVVKSDQPAASTSAAESISIVPPRTEVSPSKSDKKRKRKTEDDSVAVDDGESDAAKERKKRKKESKEAFEDAKDDDGKGENGTNETPDERAERKRKKKEEKAAKKAAKAVKEEEG